MTDADRAEFEEIVAAYFNEDYIGGGDICKLIDWLREFTRTDARRQVAYLLYYIDSLPEQAVDTGATFDALCAAAADYKSDSDYAMWRTLMRHENDEHCGDCTSVPIACSRCICDNMADDVRRFDEWWQEKESGR